MLVKMDTYFDGEFWCARGTDESIFTQGATYDELRKTSERRYPCTMRKICKKGRRSRSL